MATENRKNLKTFLKELINVCNEDVLDLRGYDKLSKEEKLELSMAIGGLQNLLGCELEDLLKKHNLQWK